MEKSKAVDGRGRERERGVEKRDAGFNDEVQSSRDGSGAVGGKMGGQKGDDVGSRRDGTRSKGGENKRARDLERCCSNQTQDCVSIPVQSEPGVRWHAIHVIFLFPVKSGTVAYENESTRVSWPCGRLAPSGA